MIRLTRIDEFLRQTHPDLRGDDECFALREYAPGLGSQYSVSNNLIINLKKPMDRQGRSEWQYKENAIAQAGRELRAALRDVWLQTATLVPMPPSKHASDAGYDDRMQRVLRAMASSDPYDIRSLLVQEVGTAAAHLAAHRGEVRPSVEEMANVLRVDETYATPIPLIVGIFDDVLTKGTHFRAAKQVLHDRFGSQLRVIGIFVARTVRPENPDPIVD
jgi:hypothetical protein